MLEMMGRNSAASARSPTKTHGPLFGTLFSAGSAASNHPLKKAASNHGARRDADNGGLKVCSVQLKTKSTGAVAALATPRRQKSQTD
jgi:hypothetical protein